MQIGRNGKPEKVILSLGEHIRNQAERIAQRVEKLRDALLHALYLERTEGAQPSGAEDYGRPRL